MISVPSGKLIIKSKFNGDIRQFAINNDELTVDELTLMMERIYKGKIGSEDKVTFKYVDHDNDLITITDSSDIDFAVQMLNLRNLTIIVSVDNEPAEEEIPVNKHVRFLKQELCSMRDKINVLLERIQDVDVAKEPTDFASNNAPLSVTETAHFDPLETSDKISSEPKVSQYEATADQHIDSLPVDNSTPEYNTFDGSTLASAPPNIPGNPSPPVNIAPPIVAAPPITAPPLGAHPAEPAPPSQSMINQPPPMVAAPPIVSSCSQLDNTQLSGSSPLRSAMPQSSETVMPPPMGGAPSNTSTATPPPMGGMMNPQASFGIVRGNTQSIGNPQQPMRYPSNAPMRNTAPFAGDGQQYGSVNPPPPSSTNMYGAPHSIGQPPNTNAPFSGPPLSSLPPPPMNGPSFAPGAPYNMYARTPRSNFSSSGSTPLMPPQPPTGPPFIPPHTGAPPKGPPGTFPPPPQMNTGIPGAPSGSFYRGPSTGPPSGGYYQPVSQS